MPTTPLCRCRVIYIGSSVPTLTKDGLQGIQEPLRQLYPVDGKVDSKGIDAWLSVWVNGLLLEYTDGQKEMFFPIQTLHYCAAVRYVNVSGYSIEGGGNEKFLPLDSPFANLPDSKHPPIFAAMLRRTSGVKVLECHAFVCTNIKAANALVRCCFHAYADSMYYMDMNENNDEAILPPERRQQLKAIKGGKGATADESSRDSSPDRRAGVHKSIGESDSDREEVVRWSETKNKDRAKNGWQRRQQAGDYETASISSSVAGRYKKKTPSKQQSQPHRAPSESGLTAADRQAKALVPFAWSASHPAQTGSAGATLQREPRRRAYSEQDLYASAAAAREAGQYGPYGPFYPPPGPVQLALSQPPHMFPGPPPGPLPPPQPPFGHPAFGPPMPPPLMLPPPPMGPGFPRGPPPLGMHPHPAFGPPPPMAMPPSPFGTIGRPPTLFPPPPPMMPMMEPIYGGPIPRGPFPHPGMPGPGFDEPYMPGHPSPVFPGPYPSDFPDQPMGIERYGPGFDPFGPQPRPNVGLSGYRKMGGRKSSSSGSSRQRSDSEDGIDGETRATIEHHQNKDTGGGIFRKTYLNEKAFSSSIQKEKSAGASIGRLDAIHNGSPRSTGRQHSPYLENRAKSNVAQVKKGGSGSAVIDRDDHIAVDYTRSSKNPRGREIEEDVHNLSLSDEHDDSYPSSSPHHRANRPRYDGQHHMLY